MLLEFCLDNELCVEYVSYERGKRKVTFRLRENEREIDFVLIRKDQWQFSRNVKVIHGEF